MHPNYTAVFAPDLGRAELERGDLAGARVSFELGCLFARAWDNLPTAMKGDHLAALLAGFYLARIAERQGQKAEARKEYQEFLSHFGNSKAPLPEIAEARAALKRLT